VGGTQRDSSGIFTKSNYRELSQRLQVVAGQERRRLVEELARFVGAGPARVSAARWVPGEAGTLRFWFTDGSQLVTSGLSLSSRDRLLAAAEPGLLFAGAEMNVGLGAPVRLRWVCNGVTDHTFVQVAALQAPLRD
jgi:hypothetical protein